MVTPPRGQSMGLLPLAIKREAVVAGDDATTHSECLLSVVVATRGWEAGHVTAQAPGNPHINCALAIPFITSSPSK